MNIHHDNCCHLLDKKSPVPVNHGRPSKSNVGDIILLMIYEFIFFKITFIIPFVLERTSQINEKLSLSDMREVRKLKQLILYEMINRENLPLQFATYIGKSSKIDAVYFIEIIFEHIHPQYPCVEHSKHSQHQRHCVRPHRFPCHHNSGQYVTNRAEN